MWKTMIRCLCRRSVLPLCGASPISSYSHHCTDVKHVTKVVAAGTEPAAVTRLTSLIRCAAVDVSPTSSLFVPRRFFWNPFASDTRSAPSATHRADEKRAKMTEKAHQDAEMENEQLIGVCLDLLEICRANGVGSASSSILEGHTRDRIWELVDVLLHDHHRSPAELFALVYSALCMPAAQEHRQVQRNLLVVLRSFIPDTLYRVFESVDLIVTHDDPQSLRQRDTLMKFMQAQLGDLRVPDNGLAEEEVLSVYVDDMKTMFPSLQSCPAWQVVERDAVQIALKAKMFALIRRLCAELDEGGTGKVKLSDVRLTAERVLGEDQAALLLEGAQADQEGRIAYSHLVSLITRPPPQKSTEAKSTEGVK